MSCFYFFPSIALDIFILSGQKLCLRAPLYHPAPTLCKPKIRLNT
jgi:hypothetical protein